MSLVVPETDGEGPEFDELTAEWIFLAASTSIFLRQSFKPRFEDLHAGTLSKKPEPIPKTAEIVPLCEICTAENGVIRSLTIQNASTRFFITKNHSTSFFDSFDLCRCHNKLLMLWKLLMDILNKQLLRPMSKNHKVLKQLLEAVDEDPFLRESVESSTIKRGHWLMYEKYWKQDIVAVLVRHMDAVKRSVLPGPSKASKLHARDNDSSREEEPPKKKRKVEEVFSMEDDDDNAAAADDDHDGDVDM